MSSLTRSRLDLRKFAWIGSAAVESSVFAIRSDLPYKTYKDVRNLKEPLNLGGTGPASSSHQFPLILTAYLNLNARIITYPSNADVFLGIERKELDGLGATYSSIIPLVERGAATVDSRRGAFYALFIWLLNTPLHEGWIQQCFGR